MERYTFTLDRGINNGEKEGGCEGEEHHKDIFRLCSGSVIFTSLGAGLQGVKSPWENPHGARDNPLQTGLAEYFCPRLPDPVKKKKNRAREEAIASGRSEVSTREGILKPSLRVASCLAASQGFGVCNNKQSQGWGCEGRR